MIDFRWQSAGGILLDGTGDIQVTDAFIPESLVDMVFTILKADSNSWKLYNIGANLSYMIGERVEPETELKIKRLITEALTRAGVLRSGDFQVETIPSEGSILAIVYINQVAVATVTVPRKEGEQITVQ
jgi:hypothetical protein